MATALVALVRAQLRVAKPSAPTCFWFIELRALEPYAVKAILLLLSWPLRSQELLSGLWPLFLQLLMLRAVKALCVLREPLSGLWPFSLQLLMLLAVKALIAVLCYIRL